MLGALCWKVAMQPHHTEAVVEIGTNITGNGTDSSINSKNSVVQMQNLYYRKYIKGGFLNWIEKFWWLISLCSKS